MNAILAAIKSSVETKGLDAVNEILQHESLVDAYVCDGFFPAVGEEGLIGDESKCGLWDASIQSADEHGIFVAGSSAFMGRGWNLEFHVSWDGELKFISGTESSLNKVSRPMPSLEGWAFRGFSEEEAFLGVFNEHVA